MFRSSVMSTTHSIRQFPLHFPLRASLCAITFQLDSTTSIRVFLELAIDGPFGLIRREVFDYNSIHFS